MKFSIYARGAPGRVRSVEADNADHALDLHAQAIGYPSETHRLDAAGPGAVHLYALPDARVDRAEIRNADIAAQLEMTGWKREAEALAARARAGGYVLTIAQESLDPFAMGRHSDVVTVSRVRGAQ